MTMLSWFSKKSSKKSASANEETKTSSEAVSGGLQSILDAEEMQMKREAFLQKKIAQELQCAREANQKGNRVLAKRHLLQKKQMTEELTRLEGHLANLSAMRFKMEESQTLMVTLKANQDAVQAFEKLKLDADKVEDQMDKARAAMDNLNEVSERLAQPLDLYDEDELLAELMDFELNEQHEQTQIQTQSPAKTQPTKVRVMVEDDEMLLELQAQMLAA